jgi:hypothetical protein
VNTDEESRLSDELHQLVASPPVALDLAEIDRRAHRSRRGQLATRALAGVAALGVAAAGGALISTQTGSASSTAGTSRITTVADVEHGITNSLNNIDNYVIKDVGAEPGIPGQGAVWVDARTGDIMETGDFNAWIYNSYGSGGALEQTNAAVYPQMRSYYIKTKQVTKPLSDYPLSAYGDAQVPSPAQFKQLLNGGTARLLGYAEVDGHRAVGLSVTNAEGTTQLWADATTYEVIRTSTALKGENNSVVDLIGNYIWLPRTASLLKQMTSPVIPSGFKQLSKLP